MKHLMSIDFVTQFIAKLDGYIRAFDIYLSEANHMKMLSMALLLLSLVLFLCLIIIIYVRSIIGFVKSNGSVSQEDEEVKENFRSSIQEPFEDDQKELEKELQRELDIAVANQHAMEQKVNQAKQKKEQNTKKSKEEKKEKETIKRHVNTDPIGFDWQKGKIPPAEVDILEPVEKLSYQQNKKELSQLIGLVVDMLGRGVDDLKIAQTLNFKTQGLTEEHEILKAIDAVKNFINLCLSGKFTKLAQYESLPKEDTALYHLANGDSSLALALVENLMDSEIDRANSLGNEEKRQKIYGDVSEYACCFGALSEINDLMLATSAYELAIELQPSNVVAWSGLGDVCGRANASSKAAWAYKKVLEFSDTEIDIAQIANANKHLSDQLYAEGNSLQAAKLYNSAKQYYDSLGINQRLDKQELEVISIIESNYKNSLSETINKLLFLDHQNG